MVWVREDLKLTKLKSRDVSYYSTAITQVQDTGQCVCPDLTALPRSPAAP